MEKLNHFFKFFIYISPLFIFGQNEKDTVFIKKTLENKIYIEENKNAKFYKEIDDFSYVNEKEECLNWVSFQKYNNKYFLYLPCEKGNLNKVSLSKNYISIKSMESYNLKISNFKRSNNYYKYIGFIDDSNVKMKLEIKIIDEINQIAVFKYTNFNTKSTDYQLMINSKNISNFEIIINECHNEKVKEVEFDNLDLKKLYKIN